MVTSCDYERRLIFNIIATDGALAWTRVGTNPPVHVASVAADLGILARWVERGWTHSEPPESPPLANGA